MKRLISMALGKRKAKQDELFIPTVKLATGPGHPFYAKLNDVLAEAGFGAFGEQLCAPFYKEGGRPGIPPGVYFRVLFIDYFVRKDSGEDWKQYLRGLAQAEGIENPTEEDLRRLDRGRKDKKVSNEQWESPSDPDSRIAKMKDGRTHLAYKAEHAVDLVSEAIVATTITFADKSDPQSGPVTLSLAAANLVLAGSETELAETVMDKGYHDNGLLARLAEQGVRTYIPERRQKSQHQVGRCQTQRHWSALRIGFVREG